MSESAQERVRAWGAELAIVLGSGLASIVPEIAPDCVVEFREIEELPQTSVPGHIGRFVCSELGGKRVIFVQGRVHLYEGHGARAVTAGVRFLAAAGIKTIVLSNAAGSLNASFAPGSWMMLRDHLNLTGTTPLLGRCEFVDMTDAYSETLRARFVIAAASAGVILHQGVYAGVLGPQYETPAEVQMLRTLGADAVGMSTVLETIAARALGMEVAAFSCITNSAAGLGEGPLSHEDVLRHAKDAAADFTQLLKEFLSHAAAGSG